MSRVGVASSSQLAAEAGARVADAGGNAVDAAVAAVMASAVIDQGLVSLAASGAVTVWPPDTEPVTIQGAPAMPGMGVPRDRLGGGMRDVTMRYGKGWPTRVGHGAVAVHGLVRACALATERYGTLPWSSLLEPAFEYARDGFEFLPGSNQFLLDTYEATFGWNPDGIADLCDESGALLPAGRHVRITDLDTSLGVLMDEGPEALYMGTLGRAISAHVREGQGLLSDLDLETYRATARPSLRADVGDWSIATYPPPSVGGATLAAMLTMLNDDFGWTADDVARLVDAQRAALGFRRDRLDADIDCEPAVGELLAAAGDASAWRALASPSTVHTSAVGEDGTAAAVTASIGYGSGVVPPGTGIRLANPLGEVELTRAGLDRWAPGDRLSTNMAPTIARRSDGAVLAIGSPGADRITTAILQTLLGFLCGDMSLAEAVAHPRLHVELPAAEPWRVAYEKGVLIEELDVAKRRFDEPNLFFGGVAVVSYEPGRGLEVVGDPRRSCGTAVGGG